MSIQKMIDRLRGKDATPSFKHKAYGKVYFPLYNKTAPLCNKEPEIYNKKGKNIRTFFSVIVLKQCTDEEYEKRLPAIIDNYKRVQQYINPWDYMFENYLTDKI